MPIPIPPLPIVHFGAKTSRYIQPPQPLIDSLPTKGLLVCLGEITTNLVDKLQENGPCIVEVEASN